MGASKTRKGPIMHRRSMRKNAWGAVFISGDVEHPRQRLERCRREADRDGVAHWRQTLAVTAANLRAKAGDRTAARRLAWRDLVVTARGHNEWLLTRFKAYDAEVTRLLRGDSHPECAPCAGRLVRARHNRDEFLAEIMALPASVPTYAEHRRRAATAEVDAETWLRRQLEGLADLGHAS